MQSIEWRPVVGYEGLYEVSSDGQLRSLDREVECRDGRTLRLHGVNLKLRNPSGDYLRTELSRHGTLRTVLVHRLVATAFHGPAPEGMEVCHGDGVKTHNHKDNLRWGTRSENAQDNLMHGTNWQAAKTHCPRGHEYSPANTRPQRSGRACIACDKLHSKARRLGMTTAQYFALTARTEDAQ